MSVSVAITIVGLCLWLIVGLGLSIARLPDIAAECHDRDLTDQTIIVLRWAATWPMWARR